VMQFRPEQIVGLIMSNLAILLVVSTIVSNVATVFIMLKMWRE